MPVRRRALPGEGRPGAGVRVPLHLLPGLRAIAGGSFDEPKWFRIERFGWMRSAHPWVVTPPGVEAFEKGALAQPKQ